MKIHARRGSSPCPPRSVPTTHNHCLGVCVFVYTCVRVHVCLGGCSFACMCFQSFLSRKATYFFFQSLCIQNVAQSTDCSALGLSFFSHTIKSKICVKIDLEVIVINCCHYVELMATGHGAFASVRATSCSKDILGASKQCHCSILQQTPWHSPEL